MQMEKSGERIVVFLFLFKFYFWFRKHANNQVAFMNNSFIAKIMRFWWLNVPIVRINTYKSQHLPKFSNNP